MRLAIQELLRLGRMMVRFLIKILRGTPRAARALPHVLDAEIPCPRISFTDALYFSTMLFISQPPADWRPRGRWRYAVMLEDLLGWLLLGLFIVTLGNVMIRW